MLALDNYITHQEIEETKLSELIQRLELIETLTTDAKEIIIKNLCFASVKVHGLSIGDLQPAHLKKYCTYKLCELAVRTDGLSLGFIPKEHRKTSLMMTALKNNFKAMKYLDPSEKNALIIDEKHTKAFLLLASEQHYLKKVQLLQNYRQILEQAVEVLSWNNFCELLHQLSSGELLAIQDLIEKGIHDSLVTDQMLIRPPEDRSVWDYLIPLPQMVINKRICLAAINKNWNEIHSVPDSLLDKDLLMAAIQINGIALKYALERFPDFQSQAHSYLDVCTEAVFNDALALQYVPDEIKVAVVDSVGIPALLTNNYRVRHFLPVFLYDEPVKEYLSQVTFVVSTENDALQRNAEIKDSFAVYARHKARVRKIIHTDVVELNLLLEDIARSQHQPQPLSLILMGHHVQGAGLSELTGRAIAQYILRHKIISSVKLFGCNTVKSSELLEEKDLLLTVKNTFRHSAQEALKQGVQFASVSLLDGEEIKQMVERFPLKKPHKNQPLQPIIFVLVKSGLQYSLVRINQDRKSMKVLEESLMHEKIKWLEAEINKGQQFSFKPKIKYYPNEKTCLKSDATEALYTFLFLYMISYQELKKYHPAFKNFKVYEKTKENSLLDKIIEDLTQCFLVKLDILPTNIADCTYRANAIYLFGPKKLLYLNQLKNEFYEISLNSEARQKLQDVLQPGPLRILTPDELLEMNRQTQHHHQTLDRKIALKGYSASLYVDTVHNRFYVSKVHLFASAYCQPYMRREGAIPSISSVKLNDFRARLFKPKKDGSTEAKSITVILSPHKSGPM